MNIISYEDNLKEKWDQFVQNHPHAWTGHLSNIFELEQVTSHAENYSLIVLDDQGQILCVLPLFKTSYKTGRFFKINQLCTGTHLRSGPLFNLSLSIKQKNEILEILNKKLLEIASNHNIDKIVMSYPTVTGNEISLNHYGFLPLKYYGYKEQNVVAMIIDLSLDEKILSSRLEYRCRNRIKKCLKDGGQFKLITDRSLWLDSYDLNIKTLGKHSLSRRALEILWDNFVTPGFAVVTAVLFNNKVVSIMMSAAMGYCAYPWIGFNEKPPVLSGSHNLLMWETILLFKRKGCHFFDVGSMEFSDDKMISISRFKESFSGRAVYTLSGVLELKPFKKALIDMLSVIWQISKIKK